MIMCPNCGYNAYYATLDKAKEILLYINKRWRINCKLSSDCGEEAEVFIEVPEKLLNKKYFFKWSHEFKMELNTGGGIFFVSPWDIEGER